MDALRHSGNSRLNKADRATARTAVVCKVINKRQLLLGSGASLAPLTLAASAQAAKKGRAAQVKDAAPATSKQLPRIPRVRLAEGLEVSQIIKGCWQLDGAHRGDPITDRTAGGDALDDLERYYLAGIDTFDTADNYGSCEAILGQYRRLFPASHPTVLTKLSYMGSKDGSGGGGDAGPAVSPDMVEFRLRAAAARLGTRRLDLVHLHWEDWRQRGWQRAAEALAAAQRSGLVGAIGVTNFDVPHLLQLLELGVKPATVQLQYSLLDRRPELFMAQACERHGIKLLPYGVLGGGFLCDKYLDMPASQARLDTLSKMKYGHLLRQLGGWAWLQDLLQAMAPIARKHGTSIANVACRWTLQQRGVAAIVVGARNALHLRDHARVFGFALDEEDLLDLDAVYEGAQQPASDVYVWERGGTW